MGRNPKGPEILDERFDFINTKSTWYFVDVINELLFTSPVDSDGSITVTLHYNIDDDIVEQIIDLYKVAGWSNVEVTFTGNDTSLYGETILKFNPPNALIYDVKRKVRHFM
jgi:hypothetical protein